MRCLRHSVRQQHRYRERQHLREYQIHFHDCSHTGQPVIFPASVDFFPPSNKLGRASRDATMPNGYTQPVTSSTCRSRSRSWRHRRRRRYRCRRQQRDVRRASRCAFGWRHKKNVSLSSSLPPAPAPEPTAAPARTRRSMPLIQFSFSLKSGEAAAAAAAASGERIQNI